MAFYSSALHTLISPVTNLANSIVGTSGALANGMTGRSVVPTSPYTSYKADPQPAQQSPATQNTAPTTNNSGPYNGGGTATGGAATDPNTGLTYDQEFNQYQSQLGGLDDQLATGNRNVNDAYTTAYNTLLGSKDRTTRDYKQTQDQQKQAYISARGQNQYQTGQQENSLQRLLGAHGYQGSANQAAAYAAARQGSIANQGLGTNYAQNAQALDQSYGDYNNQWNNSANDLGHQRDVQKNQLQARIDQSKIGLLQQLQSIANARGTGENYQGKIDGLNNEANSLGQEYANPVLQATPPVYQAPSLASYTVSNQAAPTVGDPSLSGAASNLDPSFVNLLLGSDQQKQNLNNIPQ